jgi:Coenzyme PQQ synthesis protein D (PqqD)
MALHVTSPRRPKAKSKGLIVEEAGGEVLVYNRENHHVHSLNDPAARIWKLCTGRRTLEQIAAELEIALNPAAREVVVRDAIAQFERLGLVETADGAPTNLSRRALARRIGIGVAAAVALPLITSIVAPTPAYAASGCTPPCSGSTPHCCCNPTCHCTANCGPACPSKVTCG